MRITNKHEMVDIKITGEATITEAYCGVSIKADEQTMNVCMRDGVLEMNMNDGKWFRIIDGKIVYDIDYSKTKYNTLEVSEDDNVCG